MKPHYGGSDRPPVPRSGGQLDRGAGKDRRHTPFDPGDERDGQSEKPVPRGAQMAGEKGGNQESCRENQEFSQEDSQSSVEHMPAMMETRQSHSGTLACGLRATW